jgi:hypothetical protein
MHNNTRYSLMILMTLLTAVACGQDSLQGPQGLPGAPGVDGLGLPGDNGLDGAVGPTGESEGCSNSQLKDAYLQGCLYAAKGHKAQQRCYEAVQ